MQPENTYWLMKQGVSHTRDSCCKSSPVQTASMQPDMTPFTLNKGCQVLEVESKLQQTIERFPEVSHTLLLQGSANLSAQGCRNRRGKLYLSEVDTRPGASVTAKLHLSGGGCWLERSGMKRAFSTKTSPVCPSNASSNSGNNFEYGAACLNCVSDVSTLSGDCIDAQGL